MRTLGGAVVRGRWGRSLFGGGLSESSVADDVAVLVCCTALRLVVMRHACTVTWCFRVRADIRETSKLDCPSSEWLIEDCGPGHQVKLISRTPGSPDSPGPLSEARSVTLRGSGYSSEDEAVAAGQLWRARLMRAFAAVRIGADFGDRTPQGSFTAAGLEAFGGSGRRTLNDVHGLTVFECEPAPIFLGIGPITGMRGSPHERLAQAMTNAIETVGLSEERQVALAGDVAARHSGGCPVDGPMDGPGCPVVLLTCADGPGHQLCVKRSQREGRVMACQGAGGGLLSSGQHRGVPSGAFPSARPGQHALGRWSRGRQDA
jgi:hypothetical protein